MFCPECGHQNPDSAKFCMKCGCTYTQFPNTNSSTQIPNSYSSKTASNLPSGKTSSGSTSFSRTVFSGLLLVLLVIVGIWGVSSFNKSRNSQLQDSFQPNYLSQNSNSQPHSESIVKQSFPVNARQFVHFKFTIPKNVGQAKVTGNFTAAGGNNDIQVLITDEKGLINLQNGNGAKVFYDSGKVTTDDINANLSPGTYYVVFNNSYSLLTPKAVNAEINLEY